MDTIDITVEMLDLTVEGDPGCIAATRIDGRWYKLCQNGCGTIFEVDSRVRTKTKWCVECRKERDKLKYQKAKRSKTCLRCDHKRDRDYFPQHGRGQSYRVCIFCEPAHIKYTVNAPKCGYSKTTDAPTKYGGRGQIKQTRLCPLYGNCGQRLSRGLWLPCQSPDRNDLNVIHNLPDDQYYEALELVKPAFNEKRKVVERGFVWWVNHFEKAIQEYLDENKLTGQN